MKHVKVLEPYHDMLGNSIIYNGQPVTTKVGVKFHGKNNRLEIAKDAKIEYLSVEFWGNNARVYIGPTVKKRGGLRFTLRMGHESTVTVGQDTSCTARAFVSTGEGSSVMIGEDCMIASEVEIRTDDAHAMYDVRTGERTNPSHSITIGDHVWLAKYAAVMGGVTIGSGSVVGFRSIVTHDVPNNCVVAGAPAKVIRRDVAWERPRIADRRPGELATAPKKRAKPYWNVTSEEDGAPILTSGTESNDPRRAP
ncbi:MAG: acyltransferase [Ancrocorticia sp.]|uniref:acyltransferase n=1 Tax=Ancrocorticia sp. TaxID=2593684 RepID=UPI003F8DDF06